MNNWFSQGIIVAFACSLIRTFWEKIKNYINDETNNENIFNTKNKFSSLKLIKTQFFITIAMVLIPLIIYIFFPILFNNKYIPCIAFFLIFFGVFFFWGVVESMFNEIIYYRNKKFSNNKTTNKRK